MHSRYTATDDDDLLAGVTPPASGGKARGPDKREARMAKGRKDMFAFIDKAEALKLAAADVGSLSVSLSLSLSLCAHLSSTPSPHLFPQPPPPAAPLSQMPGFGGRGEREADAMRACTSTRINVHTLRSEEGSDIEGEPSPGKGAPRATDSSLDFLSKGMGGKGGAGRMGLSETPQSHGGSAAGVVGSASRKGKAGGPQADAFGFDEGMGLPDYSVKKEYKVQWARVKRIGSALCPYYLSHTYIHTYNIQTYKRIGSALCPYYVSRRYCAWVCVCACA